MWNTPGQRWEFQIHVLLKKLCPDPNFGVQDRTWEGRGIACCHVPHTHLAPRSETLRYKIRGDDLAWIQVWDCGYILTITYLRLHFYGHIFTHHLHVPELKGHSLSADPTLDPQLQSIQPNPSPLTPHPSPLTPHPSPFTPHP